MQIIFKKYLSTRQWLSLILLTFGCMLKQLDFNALLGSSNAEVVSKNVTSSTETVGTMHGKNMSGLSFSISAVFIFAQTIFSCLAGVYNEYLLKDKGADVNIFVQNVFMYLDSIVCNALILILQGQFFSAFTLESLSSIFRFKIIIIIINNAAIGIVTSFFLKYMNSILKTFASALELMFTAVLCYFLFAIPIYINTALAIAVVSYAIYLYSQSPVVNLGKVKPLNNMEEANRTTQRKLLDSDGDTDLEMDNIV